jgi:transcription factor E
MQANFLKDVVESIAGNQAIGIVSLLVGKKDVNEFIIAKKLKLTINQARNILYKLSEAGLVTSIRKKDKRKGWFIYFWTFDELKALELLERQVIAEIKNLNMLLKVRKFKRFYFCKTCNIESGEEAALLNQFTCQECGQVYELADNSKPIKEIENKILKAEKLLSEITKEREPLTSQKDKKIKRKDARIKNKEAKVRKLKREEQKKKAQLLKGKIKNSPQDKNAKKEKLKNAKNSKQKSKKK